MAIQTAWINQMKLTTATHVSVENESFAAITLDSAFHRIGFVMVKMIVEMKKHLMNILAEAAWKMCVNLMSFSV
ncbi:hypothetical protein X975_15572, partial [Stegodyphus mimosarum]